MKKIITFIFSSVLFFSAHAQSRSGGFRVGLNLAQLRATASVSGSGVSGSASQTTDTRTGFMVGLYRTWMFNQYSGIQGELLYNSVGGTQSGSSQALNYLSVPVFYRYNANETVHLLVGPQLGYLLSVDPGDKSGLNDMDFGLVFGVGADFDKINLGVRYNLGIANILKNSSGNVQGIQYNATMTNVGWQIVCGIKVFGN